MRVVRQFLQVLRRRLDRWLFRLKGVEPSPILLVQRRVFVLPTGAGIAFAATLVLLLIGAINYLLSLGFVLTFLLAGLGIVAILHTFRNLAHLEIEPGRCEPCFAGENAALSLTLRNSRPEPRPRISVRAQTCREAIVDLPSRSACSAVLMRPAERRGWLRPGRIKLETVFPLGLVRAWSYVEPDLRCLVYPAPERHPPPIDTLAQGADQDRSRTGGTDDFTGLREHQPSDSPAHIAWKSVARESPLLTKQFAGGGAGTIWLDWNLLPASLDTEGRLSRLTAYVLQAQSMGVSFGLRMPGRTLPPATGEHHIQECLRALALFGFRDEVA